MPSRCLEVRLQQAPHTLPQTNTPCAAPCSTAENAAGKAAVGEDPWSAEPSRHPALICRCAQVHLLRATSPGLSAAASPCVGGHVVLVLRPAPAGSFVGMWVWVCGCVGALLQHATFKVVMVCGKLGGHLPHTPSGPSVLRFLQALQFCNSLQLCPHAAAAHRSSKPCNAETPGPIVAAHMITPTDLFYVRCGL